MVGCLIFFAVESAIRQGCPFSPLAFALAIDLLAIKIRDSKDIRGIRHWNFNDVNFDEFVKIALCVDDITLFIIDETDLQCALGIFDEFSHISGLTINTPERRELDKCRRRESFSKLENQR